MDNGKKEEVKDMFNDIAGSYDFLNHFLSLGIDRSWRRKAVKILANSKPSHVLDVATGTGDFAIRINKDLGAKVTGVDISLNMLEVGRKKMKDLKLDDVINLEEGDSENLQFEDNIFDAVTVAFGVRNFENLDKGLKQMNRVLKRGGNIIILEFSKPTIFPFKQFYNFYSFRVMPFLGGFFAKNKKAYTYLPESVRAFPDGDKFIGIMRMAGFSDCYKRRLSLGIVTIYVGLK